MRCAHRRQIVVFAGVLSLFGNALHSALYAQVVEVGLLYDTPGTHQVPAVNFVGNSAATSNIALRAGATANVEISNEFLFLALNYSTSLSHAIGIETLDDSTATIFPAAIPSVPNYQVRNYNFATGLIARDRSMVDFQGFAWIVGGGNVVFAQVSDDAKLLFSGELALHKDSHGDAVGFVLSDRAFISQSGLIYLREEGTGSAIGVKAGGSSESVMTGEFHVSDFGNGSAILVSLGDQSTMFVAGTAQVIDQGNGDAVLVSASGLSRTYITGNGSVHDTGNGNAVGVRATGQSVVDFRGDYSLVDEGNGHVMFFDVGGQAYVHLQGTMRGTASGNSAPSVLRLTQSASLDFTAGVVEFDARGGTRIDLLNQSTMTWSGGQFDFHFDGGSYAPLFVLSDTSTLRIRAQSVDGEWGPVKELQNRLSGILADGSSFVFDFQRSPGATVLMVPEPAVGVVLVAVCVGLATCAGRKRSIV